MEEIVVDVKSRFYRTISHNVFLNGSRCKVVCVSGCNENNQVNLNKGLILSKFIQ